MPIASVHPMVVGRSDGLLWCKTERLWRSSEERSEAPVEPTMSSKASVQSTYYVPETLSSVQQPSLQHRMNRCPIRANVGAMTSASATAICGSSVTGSSDAIPSVHPMVPKVAATVSECPTASSVAVRDRKNRCPCTGSSDAYAESC